MFGALAGKLLVEGRRPILLNHCVPANHRVSCQAGEGGLPIQKYNLLPTVQYYIFSIPATISKVLLLF